MCKEVRDIKTINFPFHGCAATNKKRFSWQRSVGVTTSFTWRTIDFVLSNWRAMAWKSITTQWAFNECCVDDKCDSDNKIIARRDWYGVREGGGVKFVRDRRLGDPGSQKWISKSRRVWMRTSTTEEGNSQHYVDNMFAFQWNDEESGGLSVLTYN